MPAQRHAEQKSDARHNAVPIGDLHSALGQLQLEPANVIHGSGLRRALEEGGEPLAAPDATFLRLQVQLARRHVIDHALTKGG